MTLLYHVVICQTLLGPFELFFFYVHLNYFYVAFELICCCLFHNRNSSNEHEINSFELLFISTTHVVPRAVVQTNNSSNEQ